MSAKTWFSLRASATSIDISIHDEIGSWGVSAKQFLSDLRAAPANLPINLSLHSPGGEVLDGLAIYNSLKARTAPVNVKIEGLAASMASVIAMAGSHISMPRNAYLMIHNPSGMAFGDSADMRELADLLDKLQGSLLNAYESRTGIPRAELTKLMEAETWMDGDDALERGFIDAVTDDLALSASAFDTRKLSNMPHHATPPAAIVAPVEPPAPAPAPVTPPIEEPATPPADENPPAPPVEPPAPENKAGIVERFFAAISGDAGLKAEIENVRASLATRDAEVATLKTENAALKPKADQFDLIEAKLREAEAKQKTIGQAAAEVAASHGLHPNAQGELPAPAGEAGSILDQFEAITDPAERTAFFQKNKAAIMAAHIAAKQK